jgi:(1->4)-alpha-D-glucan 1-alpha-D-glucosylmutase
VLKIASPGVPDVYQGTELWSLTLVDPDNRRPVDFEARAAMMRDVDALLDPAREPAARRALALSMLERWEDGRVKLLVTAAALRLRRDAPFLRGDGAYDALEVTGPRAAHAVALARRRGEEAVIAVVPRFTTAIAPAGFATGEGTWGETEIAIPDALAGYRFVDAITGAVHLPERRSGAARLRLGSLLDALPVALLRGAPDGSGHPRP